MVGSSNKKMLLIFPPQWTPISPHFAIPSLMGQLKANGFDVEAMDLNLDFFDTVLTKKYVDESIKKAKDVFEYLKKNLSLVYSPSKSVNSYSMKEQIFLYKYSKLKNYLQTNSNNLSYIPFFIEESVNNIKSDKFYNPETFIKALNNIDKALEIISLPYLPTRIMFEGVNNPFFKFNYENIKYFVFDETSNIYIDYFKSKLPEILEKKADFIALSLNSSSQIVPSFTLSNMLKEKTKAHINIGGNFFGRIAEGLMKHKEFFQIFADSVSVEEGEGPILETAKYINGLIKVEQVPNLLYMKDGVVVQNEKMKPVRLNNMANMDLSGYNLDNYYAPKIVLPYQSSRGCYWGKCSFCDQDFGQELNFKESDKIVAEFKEFKEKYNIDSFEFIDESLSPPALNSLSDNILQNNIDVKFFADARLEQEFTYDLLNKAHSAGFKMALWGLESGSRSVMDLINKGVDFDKRFDVLKNSKKAGIWNFAFIFFGFPTETVEDAKKTINMLVSNKDIIHSYGRSIYTMGRHSKLAENPEKYGITKIYPAEDEFSPNINFDGAGMNKDEMKIVVDLCLKECSLAYHNPLWMYLRTREWLFLYVDKYGPDWVKQYKVSVR